MIRVALAMLLGDRTKFLGVALGSLLSTFLITHMLSMFTGIMDRTYALITDLKQRGLLDSTLIVWCGEFGRTPDNGVRGGTAYGRDHNPNAMTLWLAGGGCNAGHTIGATDDLGMTAVEGKAHVRDFHVTLLRLLGLDDNKLTYYHAGRFKQLSQFGGTVIKDLIA
jgi:hypothetical protein